MGLVYADITLRNATDVEICKRGLINEQEIRQTTLTAMVDTGSATLVINESIRQQLGLDTESSYIAELADGSKQTYSHTEPVQIQWKNRKTVLNAIVVPGATEALLGAIPLEAMDLVINPLEQELTGAHGDEILLKIK